MKIVLFAHVPPPFHGQSYMIKQLVDGLGNDQVLYIFHVDARFSGEIADIGKFQALKIFRSFRYCAKALWLRFRHGANSLFLVPASPGRSALWRDLLTIALLRPFFRRRIYYWQAAGLSVWAESSISRWERGLAKLLLGRPDLSIVLGQEGLRDAHWIGSRRSQVIPNFIPDPCSWTELEVLENRRQRRSVILQELLAVRAHPEPSEASRDIKFVVVNVCFISLCHREKGLFDAVEAISIINSRMEKMGRQIRFKLTVAGKFWKEPEEKEFLRRVQEPDLKINGISAVDYVGFVGGEAKDRLFRTSDVLCFPSYYSAESFPIVIVEAMAWALPVVTTRWRSIPELFPENYPGIVEIRRPDQIAERLLALSPTSGSFR